MGQRVMKPDSMLTVIHRQCLHEPCESISEVTIEHVCSKPLGHTYTISA